MPQYLSAEDAKGLSKRSDGQKALLTRPLFLCNQAAENPVLDRSGIAGGQGPPALHIDGLSG
jgi:hypothetical protein